MPRTKIVEDRPGYLRAESTSRIFRFVDDLELLSSGSGDRIDVRFSGRNYLNEEKISLQFSVPAQKP